METGPLLKITDPMDYTPHFEINHDVYIPFIYISHIEIRDKVAPMFSNLLTCAKIDPVICFKCISLKVVSKVSVHNEPALVEIMAWQRASDKPLSKPVVV